MELSLIIRYFLSEINDLNPFRPVPGTNSKELTSTVSDKWGFVFLSSGDLSNEILKINSVTGMATLLLLWELF